MKNNLNLIMGIVFLALTLNSNAQINAWINEIHYDNTGGDIGEFVEIVIENAGNYTLSNFTITLYNGNNGTNYKSATVDNFTPGIVSGNFSLFSAPISGIQNGSPDGVCLDYNGIVIQLLSYEGSFTATDGAASGITSTDIGVNEISSTDVGHSLQLTGTGAAYSAFSWAAPASNTQGNLNTGQALSSGGAATPSMSVSTTSIANLDYIFGAGPSASQAFSVSGSDLNADITVTPPNNFEISDNDVNFQTTAITLTNAGGTVASTDLYVRLISGLAANNYSGTITCSSTDATDKTINLNGKVEQAKTTTLPYSEDFESGFGLITTYDAGGDDSWNTADDNGNGVAECNGYPNDDAVDNDWLILPGIDFRAYNNVEMTFDTKWKWGNQDASNYLKLLYSTDYAGVGDPTTSTWNELAFNFHADEEMQLTVDVIDLSAISAASVYIAFEYNSDDAARRWYIDNIEIKEADAILPTISLSSNSLTNLGYLVATGPGISKSFDVEGSNLTADITVTPPTNFEISLDDANWQSTAITLSQVGGSVASTKMYARLIANLALGNYNENITLASNGAFTKTVTCDGDVIPDLPDLVINEILADPDGNTGDANNDGTVSTSQDEFVEIVNNEAEKVDISGYILSDGWGARHVFPEDTKLLPNEAVIVFGGGSPTGFNIKTFTASTGSLGLNNGGDDVTLTDASSNIVTTVSYGAEGGDNQSLTRNPDITGAFVKHSTAMASMMYSPATYIDGTSFTIPPPPVPFNWKYIFFLFIALASTVAYRRLR